MGIQAVELCWCLQEFTRQENDRQHASMQRHVSSGPTSVGVRPLQAFGIHYVDLSDQLRVATHPSPTRLRGVVQSQLSGKERAYAIKVLKPAGLKHPFDQLPLQLLCSKSQI